MRVQSQTSNAFTQQLKQQQEALPKPPWLKIRPPDATRFKIIQNLLREKKLTTVCEEAHCPNMSECWSGETVKNEQGEPMQNSDGTPRRIGGTATFMLMGDTCTRACRFCMVKSGNPKGKLPKDEPKHVAEAVKAMGLTYVVLTCVTRDDLPDGGAQHFMDCVTEIKNQNPGVLVETLISDLDGNMEALKTIVSPQKNPSARTLPPELASTPPEVLAHNLETVRRLQAGVRDPRANYEKSLKVLQQAKKMNPKLYTKSSLMLGLGETEEEVIQTMKDLRAIEVDVITFGQYLRPSPYHLPVHTYITPQQFKNYETLAKIAGFVYCASGPFVRSSYRAGELFLKNALKGRALKVPC